MAISGTPFGSNSFRRRTRAKSLREFRLHRQEKFLYICDLLDMWEWELRVMDIQEGAATEDPDPLCLGGRGAAPPESCETNIFILGRDMKP